MRICRSGHESIHICRLHSAADSAKLRKNQVSDACDGVLLAPTRRMIIQDPLVMTVLLVGSAISGGISAVLLLLSIVRP